jgi:Complex I intermediate-associated protein 30 (CIA30)
MKGAILVIGVLQISWRTVDSLTTTPPTAYDHRSGRRYRRWSLCRPNVVFTRSRQPTALAAETLEETTTAAARSGNPEFIPVFDFASTSNRTPRAVDQFERLDDAIMGGISTSTLIQSPDQPFARWFGQCRTDGG